MKRGKGHKVDEKLSVLSEGLARKVSRRRFLARGVTGVGATIAATTLMEFEGMPAARASTCGCSPPRGVFCGGCQNANSVTCPAGCSVCTRGQCSGCIYTSGYWVGCSGQGTCGNGYNVCYDCKCGSCSGTCGCGSNCRCCGCCSPAELWKEQARYEELALLGR